MKKFFVYMFVGTLIFLYYTGAEKARADQPGSGVIRAPQTIEPCAGEGNQDGVHRQYSDDGKLFMETHCAGGRKQGASIQYRPDGSPSREESYVNDQLEGSVKEYYRNGLLNSERHYKNGKLDGAQRRYFENGQVASEQEYANGTASAPAEVYDNNGNLAREERFDANSPAVEYFVRSMSSPANVRLAARREAIRNEGEVPANHYRPYLLEETESEAPADFGY
ncbi:MAG: toxin-antitoxin system YwqK family antitoxin [Candidatus Omnitrophica bacterium]|nr:toxin-antitoxin system YwqK family antitoxin [Candidatus Omnitrophota bacterium]